MFRAMRRKKQQLPEPLAKQMLFDASTAVLAVRGDGGYPYAVPVNFVFDGRSVYFHCAKEGHKLDAIRNDSRVSLCVVDTAEVAPKDFATHYKSAIAFGKAAEVTDEDEKRSAMQLLNQKYSPGLETEGNVRIQREWNILCVIKIEIEHLSGKDSLSLMKKRLG